jgi:hypothetical protein
VKHTASIFREEVTSTSKMDAECSSERFINTCQTTWHSIPDDSNLQRNNRHKKFYFK